MTENIVIEYQKMPVEPVIMNAITTVNSPSNFNSNVFESSDEESPARSHKTKRRVRTFSESDSDVPSKNDSDSGPGLFKANESDSDGGIVLKSSCKSRFRKEGLKDGDISDVEIKRTNKLDSGESSSEDLNTVFKKGSNKSRIWKVSVDDDSDSQKSLVASKNEEQQLRMKNKKNKLKDKFKSLLHSRDREMETQKKDSDNDSIKDSIVSRDSDDSNDEQSSIDKIKQIIKERSAALKLSICDPDSSDEESSRNKKVTKPRKEPKRTKMISPKPQRMTAKEAMENMQKIKSESNRMLREREVSLPYHRPKALSLQDIMKRRRPAVSSDGKVLPIKMNEEQLKQYALSLEQRQKEMMELCKSESEDEDDDDDKKDLEASTVSSIAENKTTENIADYKETDITSAPEITSAVNDDIYTELVTSMLDVPNETNDLKSDTTINKISSVNDSHNRSGDLSAEMQLVYNDSIEEDNGIPISKDNNERIDSCVTISKVEPDINVEKSDTEINEVKELKQSNTEPHNTEIESQLISLHYDSEKNEHIEANCIVEQDKLSKDRTNKEISESENMNSDKSREMEDFPDDDMDMDDINMEDIDSIIENAEIVKDTFDSGATDSPALIRDIPVLNVKPKLTGAPGMVIDLDGTDPVAPKKLTGVELLKERYTFFAKLKTPEEMEREREKSQKPGTQHLKLKQELENIIAEQRSLEWSKRLEGEKLQQMEMEAVRGDASDEDDIDKIESKLEDNETEKESSSESEGQEDLVEDDVLLEDKPKKKNPLLADEAEESDIDENAENCEHHNDDDENSDEEMKDNAHGDNDLSEEDSSDEEESSESEDESEKQPKKGRILKAFEDSDEEEASSVNEKTGKSMENVNSSNLVKSSNDTDTAATQSQNCGIIDSQDDDIQLAQITKQISSDVFASEGSANNDCQGDINTTITNSKEEENLGTQTFSILTSKPVKDTDDPDKLTVISEDSDKLSLTSSDLDKLPIISETQPYSDDNLDAVVGMCSGSFQTQNCIEIQPPSTQTQATQSQLIGDDLLAMCTGKFYDNQFVSPSKDKMNTSDDLSQEQTPIEKPQETASKDIENVEKYKQDGDILKSVLEELNEPDFAAKPLKFFSDGQSQNKENEPNAYNSVVKKRFIIESDDETNDNTETDAQIKKKKKRKKKKLEQRALQISDDEEEYDDNLDDEYDDLSENEENNEEERLIEYDSEENEVEIKPQNVKKKKAKTSEFLEREAELTSEDEWVGSGDEDEAGLDRMEREAGDDDAFHQGKLQRELGQIHMREVLDQDKREVRIIQELLFEDGDLGGGGRQRKFRWRNADGEEASGTVPDEFADTQEEEFESEEQWRKQRHEREMFLRQMKNDEKEDELNVSVNRTTIIKANLCSRTMSSLLEEANQSKTEVPKEAAPPEKKAAKDIPSPAKKPFTMFQQNYHGSLLTRGQGALARLAALAAPLAAAEHAPPARQPGSRNFVFAALTQGDPDEPKVTKRKAENNVGTPRLVKKMKSEEKNQSRPNKSSLLDFLKT